MYHSTGGAISGGWNLWTNGYISQTHTFPGGSAKVTVYAAGQVAAGVWPHMIVSVGGVQVGAVNVSATSFAPYSFSFSTSAGAKEIRVSFDNDYLANGEDRNLLLQKVVVGCP
jgi:hypothetical protein